MVSASIEHVQQVLRDAAVTTVETEDYLSYATVIDLNIGDPTKFSMPEAVAILDTLNEILRNYEGILYNVGWDIPELLLKYASTFYFEDRREYLLFKDPHALMDKLSRVAWLLCEKANAKELFLKSCQLLEELAVRRGDESKDSAAAADNSAAESDETETTPVPSQNEKESDEVPFDPSSSTEASLGDSTRGDKGKDTENTSEATGEPVDPVEKPLAYMDPTKAAAADPNAALLEVPRTAAEMEIEARKAAATGKFPDYEIEPNAPGHQNNVELFMLFNLMHYSMSRIKTAYPSRFLATAMAALLAATGSLEGNLSLSLALRRLYLLARDFDMDMSEATPEEQAKVRDMLRSYLTHAASVTFIKNSVKWSDHLYYQLVNKVATNPSAAAREKAYNTSMYTSRTQDALSRVAQLALSFDMNPGLELEKLVQKHEASPAPSLPSRDAQAVEDAKASVADSQSKGTNDDIAGRILVPSAPGLFLLTTHLHFTGEHRRVSLEEVVATVLFLYESTQLSEGVIDAILYWTLWSTSFADAEEVQEIDTDDFATFLQLLLGIAATTPGKQEVHIAYSTVAKLLRLQKPDVSYDFVTDTLRTCPFDNVLDAVVQMLKMLVVGKTRLGLNLGDQLAARVAALSISTLDLTAERRQEVGDLAALAVNEALEQNDPVTPYIFSWLNFLAVVDVGQKVREDIVSRLSEFCAAHPDVPKINLLQLAIENVARARSTKNESAAERTQTGNSAGASTTVSAK